MNSSQVFVLLVLVTTAHISFAENGYGPGEQDWGYVDVREGAHMFYWLHKTISKVDKAAERPLILWLYGGTGASTGMGNFMEIGPLNIYGNYRHSTWSMEMNVLYIDAPVGSGFSYVDNDSYLATNNSQITLDLMACMKGFFALHKEFEDVPLHVFSQGYGSKMALELTSELYKANQRGDIKCKITSLVMGNPWISPIDTMLSYAPFLFYTGFVDEKGHKIIMDLTVKIKQCVEKEQWHDAMNWYSTAIAAIRMYKVDFLDVRRPLNISDYNQDVSLSRAMLTLDELMRERVSKVLGIPDHVRFDSQAVKVYEYLREDMLKPAVHIVNELLETTDLNIGVYSGLCDLLCNTAGTLSWIGKLKWSGSNKYVNAKRVPLSVNNIVEGYEKSGGNFNMFWVNRAGHLAPADNPAALSYILKKLTNFTSKKSSSVIHI